MHLIHTPRWKCDWCGKTASRKKSIERHEATCFANPAKRACKTCKHDYKTLEECYCAHPDKEDLRSYGHGLITCRDNCPGWEPKN